MTSAATSMSRIAIQLRPMWPRTRFFANSAISTTISRQNTYFDCGDSTAMPNTRSAGTDTLPEGESFVNQPMRANAQSEKELRGQRRDRQVEALDPQARHAEQDSRPAIAHSPPMTNATITFSPGIRMNAL